MKRWLRIVIIALSMGLVFSTAIPTEGAGLDDLKGSNHFINYFAKKNGSNYYINSGELPGKVPGIYKVANNMQTVVLIKAGNFENIHLYNHSILTFNKDANMMQRYSFTGTLIRQFPEVTTKRFVLDVDWIYYNTGSSLYKIYINGQNNSLLHSPPGQIDEFTVHNGWLYYTNSTPLPNDPNTLTMNFTRLKISSPATQVVLASNVKSVNSFIVRGGYVYSVILMTEASVGAKLYRTDYSGNNKQLVSTVASNRAFIGTTYLYFVSALSGSYEHLYRKPLAGGAVQSVGQLPGYFTSVEHHDGTFYFQLDGINQNPFSLYRILQTL